MPQQGSARTWADICANFLLIREEAKQSGLLTELHELLVATQRSSATLDQWAALERRIDAHMRSLDATRIPRHGSDDEELSELDALDVDDDAEDETLYICPRALPDRCPRQAGADRFGIPPECAFAGAVMSRRDRAARPGS